MWSSETLTASSDGIAIQGDQKAGMVYPVNWNRAALPSSTDVTTTLLSNGYPSNDDKRCKAWCRECVCLVLGLVALVGSFVLFFWTIDSLLVKAPPFTFKVISLEVASMTISNHPSSDIQKYDLNLILSLTNKNQELLIEPLIVSIMYDDEFLSSRKMNRIYTCPENHKSIPLDMGITTSSQLNVETVDSIATDLAVNHSLELKILIQGRYSILKSGANYDVAITCEGVKVNFSLESNLTTGSLINGPCSCKHIVA